MNNNQKGLAETLLIITKALLFVSITVIIVAFAYLSLTNRDINKPLDRRLAEQEQFELAQKIDQFSEWKYDHFSDVAADSGQYPIVVLRSGYKIIKLGADKSLIGWKFDLVNTSPQTAYKAEVDYRLLDVDNFEIVNSSGDTWAYPESHATIYGTMYICNSDLERLSDPVKWGNRTLLKGFFESLVSDERWKQLDTERKQQAFARAFQELFVEDDERLQQVETEKLHQMEQVFIQAAENTLQTGLFPFFYQPSQQAHTKQWNIQITPNWTATEKETQGTRYERLMALSDFALPYWAKKEASNKPLFNHRTKWGAIQEGLNLDSKNYIDEKKMIWD